MKMDDFLSQHAVFTIKELDGFLSERGSFNSNTRRSLLTYYRKKGRIMPIRRGLYATVPVEGDPESFPVDPYLLAAKITPDSVIAYHTALEFYGKAYSVFMQLHYISETKSMPLTFQSHEYIRASVPPALLTKGQEMFGVNVHRRSGVELRITNLERTMIDVLDRSTLSGSWEEIWRSLESIEFFDLDQVLEYLLILENRTTAAKVGFFLEQHREALMVEEVHLKPLRKMIPAQTHYFARSRRKDCQWVKDWNLMIPVDILNRSWEEVL